MNTNPRIDIFHQTLTLLNVSLAQIVHIYLINIQIGIQNASEKSAT